MEYYSCGIADVDEYCLGVVNGKIPACKYVKQAVDRHFKDLEKSQTDEFGYFFLPEAALHFIEFAEKCYHYKGRWAGTPLRLLPWQKFVLGSIFGWLTKDPEFVNGKWRHLRRFREAYLEVPRKNGKTFMLAVVALYLLKMDEESASEVYSAATHREQAKIVFEAACLIIQNSPTLINQFQVRQNSIVYAPLMGSFKPLSRETKKGKFDGLGAHGGIFDELHAWDKRDLYDAIDGSTGARLQPLLISITTAGNNLNGICYDTRKISLKILNGTSDNNLFFAVIYTLDEEDEPQESWRKKKLWKKANPSWEESVQPDDMERLAKKADEDPGVKNMFLTKRLNIWLNSMNGWMDMEKWNKQKQKKLALSDFKGHACYISLDLASKLDLVGLRYLFYKEKKFYAFGVGFCPEARIKEMNRGPGKAQYQIWKDLGEIIPCGEVQIDQDKIKEYIEEILKTYEVLGVGMDNYNAAGIQTWLQKKRIEATEIGMTAKNLSEPMKEIRAQTYAGCYFHTGDSAHTWSISNVVCKTDANDNIFPRKENDEDKIDLAIPDIMNMALHLAKPIRKKKKKRGKITVVTAR